MCQSLASWPEIRGCTGKASSSAFNAPTASASRPAVPRAKTSRSRRWARLKTERSRSVASSAIQVSAPKRSRRSSRPPSGALTSSTARCAYASKFTPITVDADSLEERHERPDRSLQAAKCEFDQVGTCRTHLLLGHALHRDHDLYVLAARFRRDGAHHQARRCLAEGDPGRVAHPAQVVIGTVDRLVAAGHLGLERHIQAGAHYHGGAGAVGVGADGDRLVAGAHGVALGLLVEVHR